MARWFDSTRLDFSLLSVSLQNQIASLATTTQDFYMKYIAQQKQDLLRRDLENVLATTEEYASSLSANIFDYFLKCGAVPAEQQPQLVVGQESNSSFSQPSLTPGQPVIDKISKAEVVAAIQQTNGQEIQMFINQMAEHKAATSQQIGLLKDDTKNELSEMRKEVAHITDILHRLADSFNQMRQFVEEYTRNNPVPNLQPQPQVQNSAPLSYPAAPGYPTSFAPSSFPPPPPYPPAYALVSPNSIGQSHAQQIQPQAPQGRYDMAYGNLPSNDLDLLKTTVFLTNAPDVVRVTNKMCHWLKRTEARVILDYIAIEECVACTWKIRCVNKDSTLRIGFMPDMPTNDENALHSFSYELCNDGSLNYKRNKEKTFPFTTGDSVRIELNLPLHHAYFFHNDRMLPFRIINIPILCKFYVCGSGAGTCAEATNLLVIPAITDVPNRPQLWDLDGMKG